MVQWQHDTASARHSAGELVVEKHRRCCCGWVAHTNTNTRPHTQSTSLTLASKGTQLRQAALVLCNAPHTHSHMPWPGAWYHVMMPVVSSTAPTRKRKTASATFFQGFLPRASSSSRSLQLLLAL